MIKNKNGITMVALVITVMVMLIIATISFVTGKELLDSSKVKGYITTMYMVKGEIENMNESYEFDGDINHLVGKMLDTGDSGTVEKLKKIYEDEGMEGRQTEILGSNTWYVLDKEDVNNLGIKNKMLNDGEVFIVNYTYGMVIYSKGYTISGKTTYSLEGLTKLEF